MLASPLLSSPGRRARTDPHNQLLRETIECRPADLLKLSEHRQSDVGALLLQQSDREPAGTRPWRNATQLAMERERVAGRSMFKLQALILQNS